ncbi:conserved domain protein [Paraprevotella xylaniphila YIT 11841]|uniref:Conserved domain protein n=1 Tax=Paraprevotella xylaniphila YIT 11841 TaxID=762982 RepID=F3QVK9_9BACT|nr:conserved domain protein [Paraprevotella xylaniphila YIT 11841]
MSWRKNIDKLKTFLFKDNNQPPQNGKSISAELFFNLSQMIFHSAEEFFTYTKHNKTDIYLFSKKHTTIKKRKDGRYTRIQP